MLSPSPHTIPTEILYSISPSFPLFKLNMILEAKNKTFRESYVY